MIALIIQIVLGAIASSIAVSKNRSGVGWFFGGFFLGIIGIVIVAVLDDPVEKQKNERVLHNNNRRLREELEMEKMKNERIQREQARRIDAHDRALNMNTKSLPEDANRHSFIESSDLYDDE
jgi:uncharacterized membrane protein YeaQ/YmgE (transglycosylase-associated protein family)